MNIGDQVNWFVDGGPPVAFPTGLEKLDLITKGGLRAGDLSVIGSATGGGKSALAEQLALSLSGGNVWVLYLSLEMGYVAAALRMAAKVARKSLHAVERDGIRDDAVRELNERALVIWEPELHVRFDVHALMKLVLQASHIQVVIIDHMRHVDGWLGNDGSHAASSAIVRQLRQFARQMHLHIILCCQLNRMGYGKRPQLHHLQDTSSLEQMASLVLLLHRPFQIKGHDFVTEMLVAKNRYGPCCVLHYRWEDETMALRPFSDEFEATLTCCQHKAKA